MVFVGGGFDIAVVGLADFFRDAFFFDDVFFFYAVVITNVVHFDGDMIACFEVHQIAEDFGPNVVMTAQNGIAAMSR